MYTGDFERSVSSVNNDEVMLGHFKEYSFRVGGGGGGGLRLVIYFVWKTKCILSTNVANVVIYVKYDCRLLVTWYFQCRINPYKASGFELLWAPRHPPSPKRLHGPLLFVGPRLQPRQPYG